MKNKIISILISYILTSYLSGDTLQLLTAFISIYFILILIIGNFERITKNHF